MTALFVIEANSVFMNGFSFDNQVEMIFSRLSTIVRVQNKICKHPLVGRDSIQSRNHKDLRFSSSPEQNLQTSSESRDSRRFRAADRIESQQAPNRIYCDFGVFSGTKELTGDIMSQS